MNTVSFIKYLDDLAIEITADGDTLRCNAPKNVMTKSIAAEIKERKESLLRFFQAGVIGNKVSIVKLASGSKAPPLFCCHGVNLYAELAAHLEGVQDVYGMFIPSEEESLLQASQDEAMQVNFLGVTEQAAQYVEAIRKAVPNGPYCLAGLSYGGIIAYEAAIQLVAAQETVQELLLIDSVLPRAVKTDRVGRLKVQLKQMLNSNAYGKLIKKSDDSAKTPENADQQILDKIHTIRGDAYWEASKQYKPNSFDGNISFFNATVRYPGVMIDEGGGWDDYFKGDVGYFDIEEDHLSILKEPTVSRLALMYKQRLLKESS